MVTRDDIWDLTPGFLSAVFATLLLLLRLLFSAELVRGVRWQSTLLLTFVTFLLAGEVPGFLREPRVPADLDRSASLLTERLDTETMSELRRDRSDPVPLPAELGVVGPRVFTDVGLSRVAIDLARCAAPGFVGRFRGRLAPRPLLLIAALDRAAPVLLSPLRGVRGVDNLLST